MKYFFGLDLGQSANYSARVIVERIKAEKLGYHLRHIERFKLGTPSPSIVESVKLTTHRSIEAPLSCAERIAL